MGWGADAAPVSPALRDAVDLTEHGEVTSWHLRNYSEVLVSERDVALSITYGLPSLPDEGQQASSRRRTGRGSSCRQAVCAWSTAARTMRRCAW
ncbi:hypothetical protein [Saccharothrix stipae]